MLNLTRVGRLIGGRYELKHLLGRGSMGEVWLAHHRTLDTDVAIKLLSASSYSIGSEEPSSAAARFHFEAQVAAHLSAKTRHIVRVTDHGEEDGVAYLVMELLDGQTLETCLMRRGRLPLPEVVNVVSQIVRALHEAHTEGVVHRDLKPGNVFLTRDEEGALLVKLLDFGIARMVRPPAIALGFATQAGVVFGTPGYMSPELVFASAGIDPSCDLWALATVAYEALTGELPVSGVHAADLMRNVAVRRLVPLRARLPQAPPALDAFFRKAFAERPESRYATARELATALQDAARRDAPAALSAASRALRGATLRMRTVLMQGRPARHAGPSGPRATIRARNLTLVAALGLLGFVGATTARWLLSERIGASRGGESRMAVGLAPVGTYPGEPRFEAPSSVESSSIGPPMASQIVEPPADGLRLRSVEPSAAQTRALSGACTPPYLIDGTGKKRWKVECF